MNAVRKKFDLALLPERPNLQFENQLWEAGLQLVAGLDEAGRGALAGPVAAGAVVLPANANILDQLSGVRDSKQLSAPERDSWAVEIRRQARYWSVGFASATEIDSLGIASAVRLAMLRALGELPVVPQHLLLDYIELPETSIPQTALVKGDARSLTIAAASILAKTARDWQMRQLDQLYPGYGFAAHKGYGTLAHRQAIEGLGASPIHRQSFRLIS